MTEQEKPDWEYIPAQNVASGDTTRKGIVRSVYYSERTNLVAIRYPNDTDFKHPRSPIEVQRAQ